jgi:hypothetical protein
MHSSSLWQQGGKPTKKPKHMSQLTEPKIRKANIRAMLVFLNFCNAEARLECETLYATLYK